MIKAFLFDLNGTMIDDMQFHVRAWYRVLNEDLGAKMSMEEVKSHMYGKNAELLVRVFGKDKFTTEEMNTISVEKEKRYQQEYKPHLRLIPGLYQFLQEAWDQQISMAIGSAAIMFNIDFVLDNLNIRHFFKTIVSAEDVIFSKPDPETYTKAAKLLGVPAGNCLVFEDAPKGVEAALNAGMKSVVLTTLHERHEFEQYPNVVDFVGNYEELSPLDLVNV